MLDENLTLAIGFILLMNIIGFLLMGVDKYKAQKNLWRIPEKMLVMPAIFGGSIGVYAGMLYFRHKTKHWHFMIGIPAIFVAQLTALIFMVNY